VRPVGIVYTAVDASAVRAYATATPPNVTVTVATIACLAVGTSEYTANDARDVSGDGVVSVAVAPVADMACVAPIGSADANVYVSVLLWLSVTVDPPNGPPLATADVAEEGKLYIALVATVTDAVVRVETNVNVNVVAAVVAVTVAPSTLLAESVAPSVAVIVGVVASVTSALVVAPDENAPSAALIAVTEWLNVNCVAIAYDATSAYVSPPAIVAIVTVSGTANAVWPLVVMTFVAPDGAVTVTRNSSAPVVVPSVIDVTATVCVLEL
jgi:hypothetical protein